MPRHTDQLRAEHAVVSRALQILEAIAREVAAGKDLPATDTALLLRFLREYLLAMHLRKESELLWPAVAMRSDDNTAAAIGNLIRLQDEVTELIHTLLVLWEPAGELNAEERAGFAATVTALQARLTELQAIEETELFSRCDALVPLDDQLDWGPAFAALAAGREHWPERIRQLAQHWLD